jgi:hypothetical protein
VDGFFQKPLGLKPWNSRASHKLLAQAVKGDHGARSARLRLAKNKRQDRNVQIDGGNPENALVAKDTVLH